MTPTLHLSLLSGEIRRTWPPVAKKFGAIRRDPACAASPDAPLPCPRQSWRYGCGAACSSTSGVDAAPPSSSRAYQPQTPPPKSTRPVPTRSSGWARTRPRRPPCSLAASPSAPGSCATPPRSAPPSPRARPTTSRSSSRCCRWPSRCRSRRTRTRAWRSCCMPCARPRTRTPTTSRRWPSPSPTSARSSASPASRELNEAWTLVRTPTVVVLLGWLWPHAW